MGLKEKLAEKKKQFEIQWKKLNKKKVFGSLGVVMALSAVVIYLALNPDTVSGISTKTSPSKELSSFPVPELKERYGFVYNYFDVSEGTIEKNEFLSVILDRYGVGAAQVDVLAKKLRQLPNRPTLRVGRDYTVLSDPETKEAEYFIYEPNAYRFFVYDLRDTMRVYEVEKEVEKKVVTNSGVIESSLWNAIVGNDMSFAIASKMEDALQWSVDFHHVQKGDRFRLYFEEDWIEGERVGVGKLIGAHYQADGNDYYAIRFKNDNYDGFFDPEGRPMKKAFLKSPVKYARISSAYNLRRFHPILKRTKPHYGTDYAAPRGTPILAVANGYIERIGRTRGNGNFIKIKHDKVYATQYLHMNGFAKGMKKGTRVTQGQTIGYVGSTGLATGPHVCFRFWKNGKQVDHRRQNLPPPDPIPESDMEQFGNIKDEIMGILQGLEFRNKPKEEEVLDTLQTTPNNRPL